MPHRGPRFMLELYDVPSGRVVLVISEPGYCASVRLTVSPLAQGFVKCWALERLPGEKNEIPYWLHRPENLVNVHLLLIAEGRLWVRSYFERRRPGNSVAGNF